jgi:hypothetical protein
MLEFQDYQQYETSPPLRDLVRLHLASILSTNGIWLAGEVLARQVMLIEEASTSSLGTMEETLYYDLPMLTSLCRALVEGGASKLDIV